jgi:dienelactone hydrolase
MTAVDLNPPPSDLQPPPSDLRPANSASDLRPAHGASDLHSALRGLSLGALWGGALAAAITALEVGTGLGVVIDLVLFAALGFAFVSAFEGLTVLVWKLLGLPLRRTRAAAWLKAVRPEWIGRPLGALFFILADVLFPNTFLKALNLAPVSEMFLVVCMATGALIGLARTPGRTPTARWSLAGAALFLNAALVGFALWRGTDAYLPTAELAPAEAVAPLALSDPGQPGPYAVATLTYGSGTDRRRPEFGAEAALTTPSLDGTPIYAGYGGLAGAEYNWFWGFDFSALPLNGRVWFPQGQGPFPLVLAVHGNHNMSEFSDPGYAYLGQHLASRGYIFVSVDQNFLNGFWLADGEFKEMPIRAWLLLEHLRQWRGWNATPGNPFYGQVDLERVGLIGHSRGGEAVGYAAALNARDYAPVSKVADAEDFQFGIRGVVAIGPSDNHYKPGNTPLVLREASYLLLAGGHDADTYASYGLAQYNRTRFDLNPGGFKAVAYIYRANHGQFNTVWGDSDLGPIDSLLLNRRPLLPAEDQQQAARVFITAFLEAALRDQAGYRAVFYNPAGARAWLPDDLYVTAYQDADQRVVSSNDKRTGVERIDLEGGAAEGTGLRTWERAGLMLRDGQTPQGTTAVRLGWVAGAHPSYRITLPEGTAADWALTTQDALSFALAPGEHSTTPLAVRVTLETAGGAVTLPLSCFGAIHPPLPARQLKGQWYAWLMDNKYPQPWDAEIVLQTYDLPLAAFQQADPAFQPQAITAIRFDLEGAQGGTVYLDQIAFRIGE